MKNEKSDKKKSRGLLPRIFGGGKGKFTSPLKGTKLPESAGRGFLRGGQGGLSAGGRGASFGSSKGLFGGGLGRILSSKAGVLGVLLGGAAILAGGAALYNLASGPSGGFKTGLFQGSFYNEMLASADSASVGDTSGQDPLGANYFGLATKGAGEELGQAQNPEEGFSALEQNLDDSDAIAKEISKASKTSKKPELKQVGALNLGGGAGGGAGAFATGNSKAFKKSTKAGKENTNYAAKGLPSRAGAMGQGLGTRAIITGNVGTRVEGKKEQMVRAYGTNLNPSSKRVAVSMGGTGVGDKGTAIGDGAKEADPTPASMGNQSAPEQDTNWNDNEDKNKNEVEEKAPPEAQRLNKKIKNALYIAFALLGLSIGIKVWNTKDIAKAKVDHENAMKEQLEQHIADGKDKKDFVASKFKASKLQKFLKALSIGKAVAAMYFATQALSTLRTLKDKYGDWVDGKYSDMATALSVGAIAFSVISIFTPMKWQSLIMPGLGLGGTKFGLKELVKKVEADKVKATEKKNAYLKDVLDETDGG